MTTSHEMLERKLRQRAEKWVGAQPGEYTGGDLDREAADAIQSLRAALSRAEAEREEARQLVIEANNSLYGSQGYFHSLDGGPFDKYHLASGIERLKGYGRAWCAALKLAAERLDVAASRVDRADTEFGFRVWAQEARDALSLSRTD